MNYKNLRYNDDFTICYGSDNKKLEKICFHENTRVIAERAFKDAFYLKDVDFPENLEIIKESAFEECGLKSLKLPPNIKQIKSKAFKSTLIKEANLSTCKNLEILESDTFRDCTYLQKINLPESITEIKDRCFSYSGLYSIDFPKNLCFLGDNAFYTCSNLEIIDLEKCENLKTLNNSVFKDCYRVEKITLPKNLIEIKEQCFQNTSIKEITFPDSLEYLQNRAFMRCENLESINLKNVKEIGEFCFGNCFNLKNVVFPENVSKIGVQIFHSCHNLEEVDYKTNTLLPENTFYGCKKVNLLVDTDKSKGLKEIFKNENNIEIYEPVDYYRDKYKSFKEINQIFKDKDVER